MGKEKFFWMPCFVNKRPAAAVFPTEQMIHYWFPDRLEEYWAIVQRRNVLEGPECASRGNELNSALLPALFLVHHPIHLSDDKGYCKVYLGDLDGKWIRLAGKDLFEFTAEEAGEHLRDSDWVGQAYGDKMKTDPQSGDVVLSLRTGLFKRMASMEEKKP